MIEWMSCHKVTPGCQMITAFNGHFAFFESPSKGLLFSAQMSHFNSYWVHQREFCKCHTDFLPIEGSSTRGTICSVSCWGRLVSLTWALLQPSSRGPFRLSQQMNDKVVACVWLCLPLYTILCMFLFTGGGGDLATRKLVPWSDCLVFTSAMMRSEMTFYFCKENI